MTLKGLPSTYNKDLQVWDPPVLPHTPVLGVLAHPGRGTTELPLLIVYTQPLTTLRALSFSEGCMRCCVFPLGGSGGASVGTQLLGPYFLPRVSQEDKEAVFEVSDTMSAVLQVATGVISTLQARHTSSPRGS